MGFVPWEGINFEEVFALVARMKSVLLLLALVTADRNKSMWLVFVGLQHMVLVSL
jgi:hypothetical protein